jgi:2'-5' RNA ligase
MKTLITIELPEEAKEQLLLLQEQLEETNTFSGRNVEEERLRIILTLFEDLDERELPEIKKQLEEITTGPITITLDFSTIKTFNSGKHIRILWIPVTGTKTLKKAIDLALIDKKNPEKDYTERVTLTRIKNVNDKKTLLKTLQQTKKDKETYTIKEFSLITTENTKEGIRDTTIKTFQLKD